ncbi:MAG: PspC domain-containing protein [Bacteroidales bacterium]|jgi:phage shock protein PspC (stress-responsive transcriptional regulator)/HAMP domain-containing protein|nr:PspC domain-containing protein [Bacteroidales bacterium]
MKEVRQISLNGIVFFVEEDGYIVLKRYINKLEQYYAGKEDGKEIIEDIQIRFSELLLEKRTFQGQAMTLSNIEEVIAILGYPENFETEETGQSKQQNAQSDKKHKRLYRDPENALLGGVCSGLSYYFGIDVVIFRLIFVILGLFSVGFWLFVYVILLLIIPSAKTTQQRYEMKGEALNIEDIEQKVKDGINETGERIKKFADNNASAIKKTTDGIYSVVKSLVKFIVRAFGFIMVFTAICVIIALTVIWFLPYSSFFGTGGEYINLCVHEMFPFFGLNGVASLLSFTVILLPFVLLFVLGVIFLITRMRKTSAFMMFGIFLLWVVLLVFVGIGLANFIEHRQTNAFSETTEISIPVSAQNIIIKPNHEIISGKTAKVQLFNKYSLFVQQENNQNHIYGITNIGRNIIYTDDTNVVIRVLNRNFKEGEIYEFQKDIKVEDSVIYIPSLFQLKNNYWSGERIDIKLLIPKQKQVVIDETFAGKRYRYCVEILNGKILYVNVGSD